MLSRQIEINFRKLSWESSYTNPKKTFNCCFPYLMNAVIKFMKTFFLAFFWKTDIVIQPKQNYSIKKRLVVCRIGLPGLKRTNYVRFKPFGEFLQSIYSLKKKKGLHNLIDSFKWCHNLDKKTKRETIKNFQYIFSCSQIMISWNKMILWVT